MTKIAVKRHDKRVSVKICTKCKRKIVPIGVALNNTTKIAKSCDCGIFIEAKKI